MKQLMIIFVFVTLGCAHKKTAFHISDSYTAQDITEMDQALKEAEATLDLQNYSTAAQMFRLFQAQYPAYIYLNRTKIGLARALTGLGNWTESLPLYREVIESSVIKNQPEFIGLASYYASYSYEALGDADLTLASLQDAKKYLAHLPREIANAEIPARLAACLYKKGQKQEANKYYQLAEKNVALLYPKNTERGVEKQAKTYYMMGHLSLNQLSSDNLASQIEALSLLQTFSLRSIEVGHAVWSAKALDELKGHYRDLWNTIMTIPKNPALDSLAAEAEQKEVRLNFLNNLTKATQQLKFYKLENEEPSSYTKDLFNFVSALENQSQKIIMTSESRMPLTPEAQRRQSLKKEGVVRSAPALPEEMHPVKKSKPAAPALNPVIDDPNLRKN